MELKLFGLAIDNMRHADDTTLVAILSVNLENLSLANSKTWFLKKAERQTIARTVRKYIAWESLLGHRKSHGKAP
jgi:hypothetical protein